jgi:AraC-like DNA-binding protein
MSIASFNIDKGYAVFSKRDYETRKHAHYAIEIICCTEGSFSVTTNHGNYTNLKNVIIPPNLVHSFSCLNATCNLLFLDPLSDIGRYFGQLYKLSSQKNILMNIPALNLWHKDGDFDIARILDNREVSMTEELDVRILHCIQTIDSLIDSHKVTLAKLSEVAFLSEGRLSHLFKKQLGISVHQYILWKKIVSAVLKSREGYSLTTCAHHVGFADSSHFNRVFYRMFGIKPFFVLKS